MFPASELREGPTDLVEQGFANLADPHRYFVWSESCHAGARFAANDPAIDAFVTYRSVPWTMPLWGRAAAATSAVALAISLALERFLLVGSVALALAVTNKS